MANDVLIVDDSEFMRNLLREILEENFEIADEAENGVEAFFECVFHDFSHHVRIVTYHDSDVIGNESKDCIKTTYPIISRDIGPRRSFPPHR